MKQTSLNTAMAVTLLATNAVSLAIGWVILYKEGKQTQIKDETTAFEGIKEIAKDVLETKGDL